MKEFGSTDQQTTQLARVSMTDGVGHGRQQQQQQTVKRTSLHAIRTVPLGFDIVTHSHRDNISVFPTLQLSSAPLGGAHSW